MDPWDVIGKAAADRRSGAAVLAMRVIPAIERLESEREVVRAARRLLRAHPAMAPLWRLCAAALDGTLEKFTGRLAGEIDAVASAASGWALPRRGCGIVTHSWSSTVAETLKRSGSRRVTTVACTASMPGGEGRALAARLRRDGLDARVVTDAAAARAIAGADLVLVGADAVTEEAVVNKVGTYACALAAREHGIACYALAGSSKLLPHGAWKPSAPRAEPFEATPLDLFDAVIGERGPLRPAAVRRAAARVTIPASLTRLVK